MLLLFSVPFIALLLCIAILPLLPHRYCHWWDQNRNKLLLSILLGGIVLAYYGLRGDGVSFPAEPDHRTTPGLHTVGTILRHSVIEDYVPFIVLLFCLYTVAGGIRVIEDIPAHPVTNTCILAVGALLANIIGTTGASMLLIRPLLQINSERTRKAHTVVFFIFIVSNVGGCLTPIGDPPLFLGYLKDVPFGWTARHLWPMWATAVGALLVIYYCWDHFYHYPHEPKAAIVADETTIVPLRLKGVRSLICLGLIVFFVATMVPGRPWLGTSFVPFHYAREIAMLTCAAAAYFLTSPDIRRENGFTFGAIAEVAALFLGIFITMTAPMEALRNFGEHAALTHPAAYFWASGSLSSFLDNAPTYLIFFTLGQASSEAATSGVLQLPSGQILTQLLIAISVGSVFMGANTYIGNGPNFMVKKIAEEAGVKMPGFFRYMLYSGCVLIPLFIVITLIFFR